MAGYAKYIKFPLEYSHSRNPHKQSGPLGTKNRSRANCVPIYGDLYQNLQWSFTFDLKVVTQLKSASEASYDVINMATIMRNCSLIKAMVCVGMVIFILYERLF